MHRKCNVVKHKSKQEMANSLELLLKPEHSNDHVPYQLLRKKKKKKQLTGLHLKVVSAFNNSHFNFIRNLYTVFFVFKTISELNIYLLFEPDNI